MEQWVKFEKHKRKSRFWLNVPNRIPSTHAPLKVEERKYARGNRIIRLNVWLQQLGQTIISGKRSQSANAAA